MTVKYQVGDIVDLDWNHPYYEDVTPEDGLGIIAQIKKRGIIVYWLGHHGEAYGTYSMDHLVLVKRGKLARLLL